MSEESKNEAGNPEEIASELVTSDLDQVVGGANIFTETAVFKQSVETPGKPAWNVAENKTS
jgi:hypothetical protein